MIVDVKFFALLFLRRIHYFLLTAIAIIAFGMTIAITLPAGYEARAKLLVESPQIPGELASSTVSTGVAEFLEIISQRILARASLLQLADRFDLYDDKTSLNVDDVVADMRKRISMSLPNRYDAASFVRVSFLAKTGEVSAQVTNELVTIILQENKSLRTAATSQTLDFFKNEVKRLDRELADHGQEFLSFKAANQGALPDSLDYRRDRQTALQERALLVDRELSGLRDRRTLLEELHSRTGNIDQVGIQLSPDEEKLKELRDRLSSALVIYSDSNPTVKALKAQIAAAEKLVSSDSGSEPGDKMSAFEIQIADLDGQTAFLSEEKANLQQKIDDLQTSIENTPANAITLSSLERDCNNIRVQYNQATADLAAAHVGDQIETQSRSQRITVIEPATVPTAPTKPNRRKIAIMSVLGGIFAGLGVFVLIELMNSSVRRSADLTNNLGITPFVSVPFIRTRRQTNIRRSIILSMPLFVGLGISVALYLLHTHYLPMDLLIEKTLEMTGVEGFLQQFQGRFGG